MTNPNQSPTPEKNTERLARLVDSLVEANQDNLAKTSRKHEEGVVLDAPMTFDDCPTATRLIVTRPKPGEEHEAREMWGDQAGYRVTILEQGGRIQTDFLVNGEEILRRQLVESNSYFKVSNDVVKAETKTVNNLIEWVSQAQPADLEY